jgi:AcrR family transcriptional regulator
MTDAVVRRKTGRPDAQGSEEVFRRILEIAAELFVAQGYPATSIEQVAARAGSGKQTIYRRFGSKEELFEAVIRSKVDELLRSAAKLSVSDGQPLATLKAATLSLLEFILRPDMVSLQRTLVAELPRFPTLGDRLMDDCYAVITIQIHALLARARDMGQIRFDDIELTHRLLVSLMIGWPHQQQLLDRPAFASEAEKAAYFEAAWSMFLHGVAAA